MGALKKGFWIMFLVACTASVHAQESRLQELENRIELLENRVVSLEETMIRLQQQGLAGDSTASSPSSRPVEPGKVAWRKLKQGMTKQEVVGLIGEPGQIVKAVNGLEYWFYDNDGSLIIAPNGRVTGWSEP